MLDCVVIIVLLCVVAVLFVCLMLLIVYAILDEDQPPSRQVRHVATSSPKKIDSRPRITPRKV